MSELQNDLETLGRYLTASESEQLYSQGIRHVEHTNGSISRDLDDPIF